MKAKLFLFFFLSLTISYAQEVDRRLEVDSLILKARKVSKLDGEKALLMINNTINLAKRIAYKSGIAQALNAKATIQKNNGKFNRAEDDYLESLAIYQQLKDNCKIGVVRVNLSALGLDQGNLGNAIIEIDTAINILKRDCSNKKYLGQAYINKGNILLHYGQLDEAEHYYLNAKNELADIDPKSLTIANENLGIIALDKGDYDKAEAVFQENFLIYEKENDVESLAQVSNTLGVTYYESSQYEASELYFKKSIKYAKQANKNLLQLDALINLSQLALEQGELKNAKNYKERIEDLIEQTGGLQEKLALEELSVEVYDEWGENEAKVRALENIIIIKDSINLKEREDLIAEELGKLEHEKNRAKIRLLSAFLISLLFLLLFIIFFFRNKAAEKKIAFEEDKRKQIEESNWKLLTVSNQLKKDIGAKIHDSVSNPLAMASRFIESFLDDNKKVEDLQTAAEVIHDAYNTSRLVAHNLVPFNVDWVGQINLRLEALRKVNPIKTVIDFQRRHIDNDTFSPYKGMKVTSMIGNLLLNVERYSKASRVKVGIKNKNNAIHIIVEDDGIGFDTSRQGVGLMSVKDTIKELNGQFNLQSKGELKKGTKAEVIIPIT